MSQMLTHIQELQKVNSLYARELYDPETADSMGTPGNVFESLLEDHPQLSSNMHGIWHLLGDCDKRLQEILWNMEE